MRINSIKLINFRQFKNVKLDFSIDENKPFTIIKGQNTFGKTTFVKAFLWCLYRRDKLFPNKIMLNLDVQKCMQPLDEQVTEVAIELDHNQYTHYISTKEVYYCRPDGVVISKNGKPTTTITKIGDDGESIQIPQTKTDEAINEILRPELTDYFFFDGESNKIEKVGSKKNLKDAVSDIMGIKRIETLKEYFNPQKKESVYSVFESKLIHTDENKASNIQGDIDDLENEIDGNNNEVLELKNEIEKLKEQFQAKDLELDANQDVVLDQKNKKKIESELLHDKQEKNQNFNFLIKSLNEYNNFLKILFSINFIKHELNDKLSHTSFNNKNSLSHISEEVIDQLVERGYCLCGTKIDNKNDAYNHLMNAKNLMEPRNYGKYASDFADLENISLSSCNNRFKEIIDNAESLRDLICEIDDKNEELKKIKKRISGRVDVGNLQIESDRIKDQIKMNEATIKYIEETTLPNKNKKLEQKRNELAKISDNSIANELTNICLEYSKNIYDSAKKTIDNKLVNIKKELTDETNDIFSKMYHGKRVVVIDDNFNATTEVDGNKNVDTSTGAETVLNYAFVAGLIKLVKNKISSDDYSDPDEQSEIYPLVIDAPFSSTDERHIINICNELPKYCNQLIFAVMEKDFKHAESAISNLIGKSYVIVQNSETDVSVEEEK